MREKNSFTLPYGAVTGMMLESVDELKDISLKLNLFGWKHADKLCQPMAVKVAHVICAL